MNIMTAAPKSYAGMPSYYAASANAAPERERLQGAVSADICIVGGGFTGLSAALAQRAQWQTAAGAAGAFGSGAFGSGAVGSGAAGPAAPDVVAQIATAVSWAAAPALSMRTTRRGRRLMAAAWAGSPRS